MAEEPASDGAAPLPHNEEDRLQELRLHRLLDTEAEAGFDSITALARRLLEVPIAAISLVDANRQWFKSRSGLDVESTPRDVAFCAHAILGSDLLVIPDAHEDSRFCNNPLVLGEPFVRFYAGAPIRMQGGLNLGTICIIDRRPRQLDAAQLDSLRLLQTLTQNLIDMRRARMDLEALRSMLPICSWCRSVQGESGEWIPLQDYISQSVSVTHSMCPPCHDREMRSQQA
jgi:GAF domain-containing protein